MLSSFYRRGARFGALRHFYAKWLTFRLRREFAIDLAEYFDHQWYLEEYKDVASAGMDPLMHYLAFGASEGRDPSPKFSTRWYLSSNSDVANSYMNPLVHYLRFGRKEGRSPRTIGRQLLADGNSDARKVAVELTGWKGLISSRSTAHPTRLQDLYSKWQSMNSLSEIDVCELRLALEESAARLPKISIITPVYNTPPELFSQLMRAVQEQIYSNWEWCLVDDCSSSSHVREMLEIACRLDSRIKVAYQPSNGGISAATNAAVELAEGEIIAFVDHDDLITTDCLAEVGLYYATHPNVDVVYSDDDKIDIEGVRFDPQFKPDWSPTLLLSYMYLSHIFTVRRSLFREIGGFRKEFDGSQDFDFALRAAEKARQVGHIPKVLYHWRVVPGSTAESGDAKPGSFEAGRKAVEEALVRRGFRNAHAVQPEWARAARVGMFDINFPDEGPTVTIVIPTKNQVELLRACVDSLAKTRYANYEVLVVDNESDDARTLEYLAKVSERPRHRVIPISNKNGRFSFAALMNSAVRYCETEFVLFLNNDTELISERWLSSMMGYAQMSGVGAVGARLYFGDRTIQHAGIVHGYHEGMVGHAFRNKPATDWGYMGFVRTAREYSAVTAACMLTPLALFNTVGGFDEQDFAVAYNDVDYCYRLVEAGWRCVYAPQAELFHYESKSRGNKDDPREVFNFREKYHGWKDRWYNPNLTLENEWFEPAAVRPKSRDGSPVKVVLVTHNLNHEGAPIFLFDLVKGLLENNSIEATVVSPCDGPLRQDYLAAGVPVHVLEDPVGPLNLEGGVQPGLAIVGQAFRGLGAEVVIANTLNTFWAVAGAAHEGIPAIWCQHESEPWQDYFNYLTARARDCAFGAFAQAYRVLYVAEATRRSWRPVETRGNFELVRYGVPPERLNAEVQRWSRGAARQRLAIAEHDVVVVVVGTVCRRKGQLDLVAALSHMRPEVRAQLRVYIAGKSGEADYLAQIQEAIEQLPGSIANRVVLTGPMEDPFLYYRAADIYVCSSHVESAPRVLVEAMACDLPIVTTPVFGIPEQVKEGVNALFYPPGDSTKLAGALARLAADATLRQQLGAKSKMVLQSGSGYREMLLSYDRIIREAKSLDMRALCRA